MNWYEFRIGTSFGAHKRCFSNPLYRFILLCSLLDTQGQVGPIHRPLFKGFKGSVVLYDDCCLFFFKSNTNKILPHFPFFSLRQIKKIRK